jgi:hypothetical protein
MSICSGAVKKGLAKALRLKEKLEKEKKRKINPGLIA